MIANCYGLYFDSPDFDSPADALWNMSFDNWLAKSAPLRSGQYALRLYQWNPGGLTIGRNQLWSRALHTESLRPSEIAVRRITGGRAIYHDPGEMTYAFSYQLHNVAESFDPARIRKISLSVSQALVGFLQSLGVPAQITRFSGGVSSHRIPDAAPHCFESVARHEITAHGRKIAAGAQRTIGSRYFQHGSLKLSGAVGHPALYRRDLQLKTAENRGNGSLIDNKTALKFTDSFGERFKSTVARIQLTEWEKAQISNGKKALDYIQRLPDARKNRTLDTVVASPDNLTDLPSHYYRNSSDSERATSQSVVSQTINFSR